MIWIFIRIRFGLGEFYPSIFDSGYSISVIDPYPNTKKLHFYDVDLHYNLSRQKLTLFVSDFVFEQKYKNKYDISNIHSFFYLFTSLPATIHILSSPLTHSRHLEPNFVATYSNITPTFPTMLPSSGLPTPFAIGTFQYYSTSILSH